MASQHHQTLVFFLLFHSFLFLSRAQSDKVDVTLYYETLCPYCSYFIANDLAKIFSNGLISIVNLSLVPWGNAQVDSLGNFQCQHGTGECLLNTVEACAINAFPDPNQHYYLIQCIESLAYQKREAEWQSCFGQTSLEPQPIFDCYNQGLGRRLELQYAYETSQLNPPHLYVPWVLVNNQPLKEDYQSFMAYICKAYTGPSTVCSSPQFEINSLDDEASSIGQTCLVEDRKNLTSFIPTDILQLSQRVFATFTEDP